MTGDIMATKTATATAPRSNGKPANEPTWHDQHDARIAKANGTLGTVPTADMYRASLTLGPVAKGKRPGVEALWVAMTLRLEGATIAQYTAAGECRTANNWLQYLNDEGPRCVYKQVHVTRVDGRRYTRLTAKGVAHLKAAGMTAQAVDRMAKPVDVAKVTAKPAPAAGKAPQASGKPTGTRKPAGKPITAPAPKPVQQAPAKPAEAPKPHPVMTEAGPKMPQPDKPQG